MERVSIQSGANFIQLQIRHQHGMHQAYAASANEGSETHIADRTPLGAVLYEPGFDIDRVLWMAVEKLREGDAVVAGVIQTSAASDDGCCPRMNLVDLRTNRIFEISQELGRHARGCRLDQHGLAEAAGIIGEAITADIDFVVINRFGKAEAEGGGLVSCLSDAIGSGIPVLTAVRESYLDEWQRFHDGLAADLSPSPDIVLAWCSSVVRPRLAPRMAG